MKKVYILDTTLRDGMQGENISFSVQDKINILQQLDRLGIDFIEGGTPSSNQTDVEFFQKACKLPLQHAKVAAFGSTCRSGCKAEEDTALQVLVQTPVEYISLFGKSSAFHVEEVLKTSREENLRMIYDSIAYLKAKGKKVFFDAEHFFDGYKQCKEYALNSIKTAAEAGADWIILCDTNGSAFPSEISKAVETAGKHVHLPLGVHCHNDMGCAVAASMEAVFAGAVQVQGTFLGFGERCGNTNLSTLIANLQCKKGFSVIPTTEALTPTARAIAEICNIPLAHDMPYVGKSAFAHKGGMHIDGVRKNPLSFEHIQPQQVGNRRNFLISEVAGKAAVAEKIKALYNKEITSKQAEDFTKVLKELEFKGYEYESANASFTLLAMKQFKQYKPFFELVHYKIIGEQPALNRDRTALAAVRIQVGTQEEIRAAEGMGPVHALDKALRSALLCFYPVLSSMRLIDYKVRVMETNTATAARVRVLIESTDGEDTWTTVGVSRDIIKASFKALTDSIEYKLIKDGQQAPEAE